MSAAAQRTQHLSQVLGQPLRHRAVPAHVARRDGRARLGFLRRHHRHRRCLRRSPQLRHGHHGPVARGAGLPRRHHRAAGLAERRAVQAVRQAQPVLRHHRRQHGLDGEPLHLGQAHPQRRRVHARRRRAASVRIAAWSSTRSARAKRSRTCPSSSAASRRRCAASRTSTTGARRFAASCCSTPRPTCWCSATPSGRSCEIAHRLAAGETIAEINDLRGTAFVRKSHDFIEIDSTHIDTPGRAEPAHRSVCDGARDPQGERRGRRRSRPAKRRRRAAGSRREVRAAREERGSRAQRDPHAVVRSR